MPNQAEYMSLELINSQGNRVEIVNVHYTLIGDEAVNFLRNQSGGEVIVRPTQYQWGTARQVDPQP